MLLEYLRQEYDNNPDQFPFPKEILEQHLQRQQQQRQEDTSESVKGIRSDEMIVEDGAHQQSS
jgi:hypothetical protein